MNARFLRSSITVLFSDKKKYIYTSRRMEKEENRKIGSEKEGRKDRKRRGGSLKGKPGWLRSC